MFRKSRKGQADESRLKTTQKQESSEQNNSEGLSLTSYYLGFGCSPCSPDFFVPPSTPGESVFERDRMPATEAGFWILVYPLAL